MDYVANILGRGRDHDYGGVCVLSEQCLLIQHCGSILLLQLVLNHIECLLKVHDGVILIVDDV